MVLLRRRRRHSRPTVSNEPVPGTSDPVSVVPEPTPTAVAAAPVKRGRGRPRKDPNAPPTPRRKYRPLNHSDVGRPAGDTPPGKIRTVGMRVKAMRPINVGDEQTVGQMHGLGMSNMRIAQALGMSHTTVAQILQKPDIAEFARQIRETTKPIVLANIQRAVITAGAKLNEVLDNEKYKDFDMLARGMYSLEKTAASAAGENKPVAANVQVAVVNQQAESEEAKQLLRALMSGQIVEAGR